MLEIYDGEVWKSLHEINGGPYLALPNNLVLALNIQSCSEVKQIWTTNACTRFNTGEL